MTRDLGTYTPSCRQCAGPPARGSTSGPPPPRGGSPSHPLARRRGRIRARSRRPGCTAPPLHEQNGSREDLQCVDGIDRGDRAVGECEAELTRPLWQRVPAVERDDGKEHQIDGREPVVPPRVVEPVAGDALGGKVIEVFPHQYIVVTFASFARQALSDEVSDV